VEDGAQVGGIVAVRDAQAAAVGEDEFEGRWRAGIVVSDVDGEERDRLGGLAGAAVALPKGSPPGVEGGDGEVLALAEGADGEAAALPLVDQVPPVLFLVSITGFALGHG
jgi:hypothetical protein